MGGAAVLGARQHRRPVDPHRSNTNLDVLLEPAPWTKINWAIGLGAGSHHPASPTLLLRIVMSSKGCPRLSGLWVTGK